MHKDGINWDTRFWSRDVSTVVIFHGFVSLPEDNDQDPFRLMINFSSDYYNRVIIRDFIGIGDFSGDFNAAFGISWCFHRPLLSSYPPSIGGDCHYLDAQKR